MYLRLNDHLDSTNSILGDTPGVAVVETINPSLSALFADEFCGNDVKLIYYLTPGTLVSRTFTSKDTHSPRGSLLVVYSEGRGADRLTLASAEVTSALLGFESPVFSYGTDLILPSDINGQLRELVLSDVGLDADEVAEDDAAGDQTAVDVLAEFDDNISVPEVISNRSNGFFL